MVKEPSPGHLYRGLVLNLRERWGVMMTSKIGPPVDGSLRGPCGAFR